jgi:hypothetical protein
MSVLARRPGRERHTAQEARVHMLVIDPVDHVRLARPEHGVVPVALQQVGERGAPGTGPDHGAA